MKEINILFWYASSKIGNSAQKIISYEKEIIQRITHDINQNGGLAGIPINIDYLELRNINNLKISNTNKNSRLFIAYYLNNVRLIDNL